jgi:hypothetical protein
MNAWIAAPNFKLVTSNDLDELNAVETANTKQDGVLSYRPRASVFSDAILIPETHPLFNISLLSGKVYTDTIKHSGLNNALDNIMVDFGNMIITPPWREL